MQIFAHVKWFVTEGDMPDVDDLALNEWVFVALLLSVGLGVFYSIDKWLKSRGAQKNLDSKLAPFKQFVPLIVRLSTATLLFINISRGYLLAPNVEHTESVWSSIIILLFIVTAGLLITGIYTRLAAALLAIGYALVLTQSSLVNVLDHFEYIGIAGYLWFRGPGAYSYEAMRAKGKKIALDSNRHLSLPVYRVGVGIALATLGLSEKLMNMTAAQSFLNHHDWNILSVVNVSDRHFIIVAGAIELLVGLALIFNYAPRLLMLIVLGLMAATAMLLGIEEIYGHVFAVGIVAAIWVNDKKPAKYDSLKKK